MQLAWGMFVSRPPETPLLDPKPESLKIVQEDGGDGHMLAELRRLLHNQMVYVILSEPVMCHLLGRVGQDARSKGLRVYIDDADFAYDFSESRPCLVWMAKKANPQLKRCWHMIESEVPFAPEDKMLLWQAGRRIAVQAIGNDGRRITLHPGDQDEFDADLQFKNGDEVYMILFEPTHQVQFQYNSLETGWKKQHSSFNALTRELFGSIKNENLLAGRGTEGQK
jgi:hypothetical protein